MSPLSDQQNLIIICARIYPRAFSFYGDVTDSTGVGRAQVARRGYDS